MEINSTGNCVSDLTGSRVDSCVVEDFGDLVGIGLLKTNTKINVATGITEVAYMELIKNGSLFPYVNLFNFEQTTPENEVATSSSGLKRSIRDAKPEGTLTYSASLCLVKSLQNKKGLNWDIVLIFDKGILLATDIAEENVLGFTSQYFDVSTMRIKQGTDIQSVSAMWQLDDSNQFNTQAVFLTNEMLGFNPSKIAGALEADLKVTAVAGTEVIVKAVASCNSSIVYEGLDEAEMWLVNGVEPTAVAFEPSTKSFKLTAPTLTAGDDVSVLLSGTDEVNIYKGSGSTIVSA